MMSPIPLSAPETALVRARLSRELHSLHRPEYCDLLPSAEFALHGRTLLVNVSLFPDEMMEQTWTLAALRSGLPVDAAQLY